uniref:Uncharacterized protein n=1 Tax=Castor canadensis TaxID=51338 RepID=A0A8C0WCR0_CASCN
IVSHLDTEEELSPGKVYPAVPPAPPPSPAENFTNSNGLSFKIREAGISVNSDFSSWKASVSKFHG